MSTEGGYGRGSADGYSGGEVSGSHSSAYGSDPQGAAENGQPGLPVPYAGHAGGGQPPGYVPPTGYGPPPGYGPGQTLFPQPYKDATAAWLFWVFLAGFGAHDFYLKRTGAGVTKLVLTLVGWVTSLILIGYVLLFAVFVWWVVDAFTLNSRLRQVNAQIWAHNRAIGAAP